MNRVYVDTNIFIAAFETTGDVSDQAWSVFEAIERGTITGVTSELTLAELLSKPAAENPRDPVLDYETHLRNGPGLIVPEIGRSTLIAAARLRRQWPSLKLPDAIHVATAEAAGCVLFLSGDLRIALPGGMRQIRLAPAIRHDLGV